MKILFVGNSLTFINDLPGMLGRVASSDPQNPVRLAVASDTVAARSLKEAYVDGCALKRIHAEHFDRVVLQERSYFWQLRSEDAEARDALGEWAVAISMTGATTEYFEDWVDRAANDPRHSDRLQNEAAARSNAGGYAIPVVSVGEAFAEATNTSGAPDLYGSDLHHPSAAGSYLAALIFFHHFTGEPAERATWRPDGVNANQAALLARIADRYS
jgi:hypothetical protein